MRLSFKNGKLSKLVQALQKRTMNRLRPAIANPSFAIGMLKDLPKTKPQLIAENALLRQQLIVLNRQVRKPRFTPLDRILLLCLASRLHSWKQALFILKPDTLLRWHRQGFKLFWRFKSKPKTPKPRIGEETIAFIIQMAKENPLWGAERIRGELLKLDISVSKRTVRKYLHRVRSRPRTNQTWCTFLRNHSTQTWACDFLPVVDFFFGQLYAFFIMELGSRRIVHFGVTRHPTDQWVAQQLRKATPFDEKPKYLIRDNDTKYGTAFARVATGTGIQVLKTPIRAPKANAMCERLMGSIRRECLDHFLILNERHLYKVLKAYTNYYNRQRPHQGIEQGLPVAEPHVTTSDRNEQGEAGNIVAIPVLGGLHHNYERAA